MTEREIRINLKKAQLLINEHNTLDALFYLDKIINETDSPEVLSSYGLCIALERGKMKDGIDLCIKAMNKNPENYYHFLCLGKIYLKENKKAIAIDVFRKGLRLKSQNEEPNEIVTILNQLGIRKKPIFPFLKRDNFFNKYLGLIFGKIGLR